MCKILAFERIVERKKALKSHRQKLNHKKWRCKRNRHYNGRSTSERRQLRVKESELRKYKHVVAPSMFSFRTNTIETIGFLNELENCFLKGKRVFVVLKKVKFLETDSVILLLSIMLEFQSRKIDFNGDYPQNLQAKEILEKSGFFDELERQKRNGVMFGSEDLSSFGNRKILKNETAKIVENAARFLWGEPRRCPGVQAMLVELMTNTNNHAHLDLQGKHCWWLCVGHDRDKKIVRFSFIDYGVGIFNSLDGKDESHHFYDWRNKFLRFFSLNSNAEFLRKILEGELKNISETGEKNRGNGLPSLRKACQRNQIQNLHIITNDVSAQVDKNSYNNLGKSFKGTFVYFEVSAENQSFPS